MSAFVIALIVKSSFVIAAAALVNLIAARRGSAASRHLVWTLAVAALIALPVLSIVLPAWDIAMPIASPATINAPISSPAPLPVPTVATDARIQASSDLPAVSAGTASNLAHASWVSVAFIIYFLGVLALSIRLWVERIGLRRLTRQSADVIDEAWLTLLDDCRRQMDVTMPVRLLRSLERSMPMAFGTRRPAIVIPSIAETWSEDRRRAVLLHELAHIARRDCLTQWVAAVTCAVYWPHPGAWWVARRLRVERELACDDRVLAIGTAARDYAEHLLNLAYTLGGYRAPALVVSMARPRQLEGRMLAALDAGRNRTSPAFRSQLAGLFAAIAIVAPLSAAMLVAGETTYVGKNGPELSTTAPQKGGDQPESRWDIRLPGTWAIRQTSDPKSVTLRINERINSSHSFTIAIDQLEGLSPAALAGAGGVVQFNIRRDAGTIAFEGIVRSGVGGGMFTFKPSATFPDELARRGFQRPTSNEMYALASGNIGFAFLDELNAQKYARPDLAQLVRAADHGADFAYLREMGRAGYHYGQIDTLVTQRDHGVTPDFIRDLAAYPLTNLSADELLRARDHGVDGDYTASMKSLGFTKLSLDELLKARDHGVDPDYLRAMTALGYDRLALVELRNARDHGVDPEYIRGMAALGYQKLSLDELIRMRDHGVDPDWTRQQNSRRGSRIAVDELIRLRDRGGN